MKATSLRTRVGRIFFRLANSLISADRVVRRSRGRGVKLIVDGGTRGILLVRHTYGNRHWTLPGGRVRRSEETSSAARREISEELSIEGADLRCVGSYPIRIRRRREVVDVFVTDWTGDITSNPVEIAAADWFAPNRLPDDCDPWVAVAFGLLAGSRAEAAAART